MINKNEQISHAEELALDRALKDINVPDDEPEDQPAEATDEGPADQLASIPDGLPSDLSEPSNAPAPEPEEPTYMPDPNADIQYESSAPIEDGKDKPLSEPKQKSAAPIIITMIVIVVAIIGGYFFLVNNHTPNPTGETPAEEEPQFQADATDIVFTVKEDGSVQTVQMKDETTKVHVRKTDITGSTYWRCRSPYSSTAKT